MHNQPVHLRNLGANLQAEAVPAAVDLTVRGNRDTLGRIAADDLTAFVDLAGLGPGQYSLTVHADSSRDAGVTRVTPGSVQIRVTSGKH
jgi:YbbR domain-containing protein